MWYYGEWFCSPVWTIRGSYGWTIRSLYGNACWGLMFIDLFCVTRGLVQICDDKVRTEETRSCILSFADLSVSKTHHITYHPASVHLFFHPPVCLLAGIAQIEVSWFYGSHIRPEDTLGEYYKTYQKQGLCILISGFYEPKLNIPIITNGTDVYKSVTIWGRDLIHVFIPKMHNDKTFNHMS